MTTGHVFIATSLDGFIARADGGLDWLEDAEAADEDHGFDAFAATMDGIVMGRATFEIVRRFDPWPCRLPVVVLSTRLGREAVPGHLVDQVSIVRSVAEALGEAARRGWNRVYVDGGATIRSFLKAGVIRDVVITRIPVLLGGGLPLFGGLDADVRLRHLETRSFPSGLVQSRYQVLDEAGQTRA